MTNFSIIFVIFLLNTLAAIPLPQIIKPMKQVSIQTTIKDTSNSNDVTDSLLFVQAIWRHGDRTPTSTFPTDSITEDAWPQGWGQLTPKGMQQHFVLGRKLRSRYIDNLKFVSNSYKSREIYVRSTNSNRTIMSATSNFIGFYSTENKSDDNDNYPKISGWPVNFVPIPIHANIPAIEDHDANLEGICKRRDQLLDLVTVTPEYKNLSDANQEFLKNLSDWTGIKNQQSTISLDDLWKIRDAIYIEKIYNKTIPDWATQDVIDKIIELDIFDNSAQYGANLKPFCGINFSKELRILRGGPLLNTLIKNMKLKSLCLAQSKQNTKKNESCVWMERLKYSVLSAHDSTISGLSSVLGTTEHSYMGIDVNPPYSSAVTIELWQNVSSGEDYIKALFWAPDKEYADDITTEISGCENGCTLNKFIERSQFYLPSPSMQEICANVADLPTSACADVTPTTDSGSTISSLYCNFLRLSLFTTIFMNYLVRNTKESM